MTGSIQGPPVPVSLRNPDFQRRDSSQMHIPSDYDGPNSNSA